jgi:hypothetical protein
LSADERHANDQCDQAHLMHDGHGIERNFGMRQRF